MKTTLALALLCAAPLAWAGVAGSKHDLTAKGPGEYRAESESDPCIFCHVSHEAGSLALSNRPELHADHRPYESSTMRGRPGAPTGSSRICLSCHDGTIAVGQTRNGRIKMRDGDRPIAAERRSHLGTDLRRTHPVSVSAQPSRDQRAPKMGDAVKVDRAGLVQCTSCHDPHDEWRDPDVGKFLVKRSARSALCVSCHDPGPGGAQATHLTSSAQFSDSGKIRTVADAGCGACHVSHAADPKGRLLKDGVAADSACLSCHAKSTRAAVAADLQKASSHATTEPERHDPAEGPNGPDGRRMPEVSPAAARHVVCVDCHDPHRSTPEPAPGGTLAGALTGVSGVDLNGQWVAQARAEYEICFKCHADSANQPQASGRGGLDGARRATADVNLRLVFSPGAVSFHPVAAAGKNPRVPSLLAPWSPATILLCTDCHASDSGPGASGAVTKARALRGLKPALAPVGAPSGAGARGPHGSVYAPILERQYLTQDRTPESPAAYALCYKCHDREVLLSERSTFTAATGSGAGGGPVALHRLHVVDQSAPCSACHVAHGVSREAGTELNNAHLVSFDLSIARPGPSGALRYETAGAGHGSCALTCHGVKHGQGEPRWSY